MTGALIPPEAPRTPIAAAAGCLPAVGFPRGVRHWHGRATGTFWAMVPWPWVSSGYRLIEARTPDELADQVRQLLGHTPRDHKATSGAIDGAAAVSPLDQGGRGNSDAAAPQSTTSSSSGARHRRGGVG